MSGTYNRKTVDIGTVHSNLEQNVIQITEDKVRLILNEHISNCEKRNSWIAPLSIVLTFLVVFATTEFKKFIFDAAVWEAIFIVFGLLSFGWLIRAACFALRALTIDDIVEKIKTGER